MKNIPPYSDDPFDFHKDVISSKKRTKSDPELKTRLTSYNPQIESLFDTYKNKLDQNKLEELIEQGYTDEKKNSLLKLYSFKAQCFQKLKVSLTTRPENIIDNICQNCTVGEVNSFDHILPKDDYCEFVVNPLNLFPCCTKCNGHKSTTWVVDGNRKFLNLYSDQLPEQQYLFVDIEIEDGDLNINYSVKNPNNIDPILFNIIDSHYDKLKLCQRFKDNSDLIVSELEVSINQFKALLPLETIKNTFIDECQEHQQISGHNFWKSLLKLALLNSDGYMNKFR
jgi:hypothetical protein